MSGSGLLSTSEATGGPRRPVAPNFPRATSGKRTAPVIQILGPPRLRPAPRSARRPTNNSRRRAARAEAPRSARRAPAASPARAALELAGTSSPQAPAQLALLVESPALAPEGRSLAVIDGQICWAQGEKSRTPVPDSPRAGAPGASRRAGRAGGARGDWGTAGAIVSSVIGPLGSGQLLRDSSGRA